MTNDTNTFYDSATIFELANILLLLRNDGLLNIETPDGKQTATFEISAATGEIFLHCHFKKEAE